METYKKHTIIVTVVLTVIVILFSMMFYYFNDNIDLTELSISELENASCNDISISYSNCIQKSNLKSEDELCHLKYNSLFTTRCNLELEAKEVQDEQ